MVDFVYKSSDQIFPKSILTDRLCFSHIEYGVLDIERLYNKYSSLTNEETKYVTFEPYNNRKQVKNFVDNSVEKFEQGDSAGYFIFTRDDYDFVGTATFDPTWEKSIAESGIFLFRQYWGNGYSTERGRAMLSLAFEEFDFEYWISKCHPDNEGSIRCINKYVVENGGEKVGVLPNWFQEISNDESYDDIMYFKMSRDQYMDN